MDTVATELVAAWSSLAVNVKESLPTYPLFGKYVKAPVKSPGLEISFPPSLSFPFVGKLAIV